MPYKTTKNVIDRMDAKRKHILDTALRIFTEKGYNNTTMKDLIEGAGISVGSFYSYFQNKEKLFDQLREEIIHMLYGVLCNEFEQKALPIAERFGRGIMVYLNTIEANRDLARIMMIEAVGLNPAYERKRAETTRMFINYSAQQFNTLQELKGLSPAEVETVAIAFIGTIYNVTMEWLQSDGKKPLTDSAFQLIIYNLRALRLSFNENDVRRYVEETIKLGGN
ncbi:MAG: TetR/AcrR family transcriptional regulator [Bacillota bacterium]|nr:TetR/AcrR family transcriptional regulator [Bacillota bacterium]